MTAATVPIAAVIVTAVDVAAGDRGHGARAWPRLTVITVSIAEVGRGDRLPKWAFLCKKSSLDRAVLPHKGPFGTGFP